MIIVLLLQMMGKLEERVGSFILGFGLEHRGWVLLIVVVNCSFMTGGR